MKRERALQVVLVLVGLLYCFWGYLLFDNLWHDKWLRSALADDFRTFLLRSGGSETQKLLNSNLEVGRLSSDKQQSAENTLNVASSPPQLARVGYRSRPISPRTWDI